jgi:hypothetical protein
VTLLSKENSVEAQASWDLKSMEICQMVNTDERSDMRWVRADLHIHTPASADYAEPGVSYLDILREAEHRDLEIIAFTDHNTVRGYEQFLHEIEILETLEARGQLTDDDKENLEEYRWLCSKITVLPGFEFTSHYGAHVLGIFSPHQPVSLLEMVLLQLGVPHNLLKQGICGIPNTSHVTDAYEIIARAGGIVIAPHANGPNGVITETLRMGTSGQSRVAATQSPHLSALEFINFYTDHEKFTSPSFYNGKTDHYTRRMFCIQGSDAHRLRRVSGNSAQELHRHGIGDRYIELMLPERSFESIKALFQSNQFERVRVPKRDQKQWEIDVLRFGGISERQILRDIGCSPEQARTLWCDVAALANLGGGVLFIEYQTMGCNANAVCPETVSQLLRQGVEENLDQQPYMSQELISYEGRDVVRVEVKADGLPPYLGHNGAIYIRREVQTVPANRSEIMQLCRRALAEGEHSPLDTTKEVEVPRSGVQIVSEQQRGSMWSYEVRDLRTTANVTEDKAQGLWAYAISRHEEVREKRIDLHSQVQWQGRYGVWRSYRQGNRMKYDLVVRDADGVITSIFYGVSDWGLGSSWEDLLHRHMEEMVEHTSNGHAELVSAEYPTNHLSSTNHNHMQYGQHGQHGQHSQEHAHVLSVSMNNHNNHHNYDMPFIQTPTEQGWGDRFHRWRGRGGIYRIYFDEEQHVRFDLAMREKDGTGLKEYPAIPLNKLTEPWLNLVRVPRPRTGIEVIEAKIGDDGEWRYVFRDLRTGDSSGAPWRFQDIKPGTVREYAARMYMQDVPLDETTVRWWGNIGYMRPMRSQVDLVYRDENGVDHIFYAARRDELQDEWHELLEAYQENF